MDIDTPYPIAVRELVEFTAKQGNLDIRFTPGPTAQQGIAGHQLAAARRGSRYQRELRLEGRYGCLAVRGRADGYDPVHQRLEEFKTYRGDLNRVADNQRSLHWAQLKIYGALWCRQQSLAELNLALVYVDVADGTETAFAEPFSRTALEDFYADQCGAFLVWAEAQRAQRQRRDRELDALGFPYADLRAGQRELAEAIYRTVARGRRLMAQAPTGIGKTIGSLFPALKAAPKHALDKLLFLVAKTSGRELALDALRRVAPSAPALRSIEIVSKETACEYPGRACTGASCPLAKGFYDRLPEARRAALESGVLDRAAVRRTALRFSVCPYYLTQELLRWVDVIVADYHYYFDTNAPLYSLTVVNQWRTLLLVDEAHNLVPRARDMYSATLDPARFAAAAAVVEPVLRAPLARVAAAWRQVHSTQTAAYQVYPEPPAALQAALQRLATAVGERLAADGDAPAPALLAFYFDALCFSRLADTFADHSLFDVSLPATPATATPAPASPGTASGLAPLCIRNVVPASFLAPRFAAASACVLFSATLAPAEFYRRLLGLPDATAWLDVPSPFDSAQLDIHVRRDISTRFRDRAGSASAIVELIAGQFARRPGNYLAFFSSFDYLARIASRFRRDHAAIPIVEQVRRGDAAERERFLAHFTARGVGIGFAVLGGVFAEGIDLPGDRLIGAFIATLGLPSVDPINAEIERRLDALFGRGFEYAYLYPGLQKVIQAAGRVIRTTSDRGSLHLIDDRYALRNVQALLPRWWRLPTL